MDAKNGRWKSWSLGQPSGKAKGQWQGFVNAVGQDGSQVRRTRDVKHITDVGEQLKLCSGECTVHTVRMLQGAHFFAINKNWSTTVYLFTPPAPCAPRAVTTSKILMVVFVEGLRLMLWAWSIILDLTNSGQGIFCKT